jgi:precorrin-6Y C5,15-methyltransferase (decarboxylating)
MAAANALALGVPGLEIVAGEAPGALRGLPAPDAVFLGGRAVGGGFDAGLGALAPGGRLVANAVTLEGRRVLLALSRRHGGELCRDRGEPGRAGGAAARAGGRRWR